MKVIIETIPHEDQRYNTLGDWFLDGHGVLHIKVSEQAEERASFLLGLHELVEAYLCRDRSIPQSAVDRHDFTFDGEGEPGDDDECPYRREHRFACLIEHLVAHELGITGYGEVA